MPQLLYTSPSHGEICQTFVFLAKYILKQKTTKIGCAKSQKSLKFAKNAISGKYSLPDLRLPSFAKCTNGSGCAVGEHSRRNVDSVDRLQWFRGERTVSVTPQRLRNEKYEFIWIFFAFLASP